MLSKFNIILQSVKYNALHSALFNQHFGVLADRSWKLAVSQYSNLIISFVITIIEFKHQWMEDCLVHTLNYPIVLLPWHYFSFFHVRKHACLYMFSRYFLVILGIHAESPYNDFSNQSPHSPSHVPETIHVFLHYSAPSVSLFSGNFTTSRIPPTQNSYIFFVHTLLFVPLFSTFSRMFFPTYDGQ